MCHQRKNRRSAGRSADLLLVATIPDQIAVTCPVLLLSENMLDPGSDFRFGVIAPANRPRASPDPSASCDVGSNPPNRNTLARHTTEPGREHLAIHPRQLVVEPILLGALFNAFLNRKRDDRLRKSEAKAVAVALKAELNGIDRTLLDNVTRLDATQSDILALDLAQSVRIMPELLSKLGLIEAPEAIQEVLDAYIMIDQYYENLLLLGGEPSAPGLHEGRRMALIPTASAKKIAKMNQGLSTKIKVAIASLDAHLR